MKNILVLMHDDEGQEARFQAALDLSRALDGHLICLDVAIAPIVVEDLPAGGMSSMLLAEERAHEVENRSRMEARLKTEGIAYDWVDTTGFASHAVSDAAGMADLIVLNRDIKNSYPDMDEIAGRVLLKSGRPIVAVPGSCRRFDAFGSALVAWDGSREAEAALRAAVPLLALAASVTLIECSDGSIKAPAEEAATYLSRHGIKPMIHRVPASIGLPSTILLDEIESREAAYLVMGGFGHSRLAEALLGGVTWRMLHESPVPLFLAH